MQVSTCILSRWQEKASKRCLEVEEGDKVKRQLKTIFQEKENILSVTIGDHMLCVYKKINK